MGRNGMHTKNMHALTRTNAFRVRSHVGSSLLVQLVLGETTVQAPMRLGEGKGKGKGKGKWDDQDQQQWPPQQQEWPAAQGFGGQPQVNTMPTEDKSNDVNDLSLCCAACCVLTGIGCKFPDSFGFGSMGVCLCFKQDLQCCRLMDQDEEGRIFLCSEGGCFLVKPTTCLHSRNSAAAWTPGVRCQAIHKCHACVPCCHAVLCTQRSRASQKCEI
jgi:hypothetical protein